jgi:hypothetical protein
MKFQDALVDSPRSRAWRGALRELLDTEDLRQQLRVAKVRQRTSLRTLPKLTRAVDGTRKIIDDPPLIGHLDPETLSGPAMIEGYVQSLPRPASAAGALQRAGLRAQGRRRR